MSRPIDLCLQTEYRRNPPWENPSHDVQERVRTEYDSVFL